MGALRRKSTLAKWEHYGERVPWRNGSTTENEYQVSWEHYGERVPGIHGSPTENEYQEALGALRRKSTRKLWEHYEEKFFRILIRV
jgi:hypothetical protein